MPNIYKYAYIIVQAGIANILKYIAYLINLSVIINIGQLMINHNTHNITVQYVGHVHTSLCGHAPTSPNSNSYNSLFGNTINDNSKYCGLRTPRVYHV